jgi:RimJ/RimL family protein N-acetyltransferase
VFTLANPLTTERLTLRPYQPDDLEALLDLFGREEVCRFLNWPPMDREGARSLLARRITQTRLEKDGDGLALLAEERASGRFAGELVLALKSESSRQGETGWAIHPDWQGRGLATEGAREMLRLGFETVGLHRIIAECDPRNDASIRVMERLGMRPEAHLVENEFLKGEWIGSVIYAMLESEWRARQPAAE